jgi:3-oxoacyl-[acyl-carrier-protein] synthase II
MKKRVVITGMEITSAIGTGLETFWEAAVSGKCGIKRIQSYDPAPYPTQVAAEIQDFSLESLNDNHKIKRYPKAVQYALFCTHHALKCAALGQAELASAGVYIGSSLGGYAELENAYRSFFAGTWKKIPPLSVVYGMPNAISNYIAVTFGIQGPNSTISNACISSAESIGLAYRQIASGYLSTVICGGSEAMIWESVLAAWCRMRVMSTNNEKPNQASRPFDLNRDGLVMGEGAAVLVLEEYSQAKARGAKIYAEILGFGQSCDANHITAPDSAGQVRALFAALDDARMSHNDIQYINAHGTGTQLNDRIETQTIKSVFGERAYDLPITAQKAMTGHCVGAAGAMDVVATALSLQRGYLLPTINLETADPACDLDYIPNVARQKAVDIALSNHFAFGGANIALILARG